MKKERLPMARLRWLAVHGESRELMLMARELIEHRVSEKEKKMPEMMTCDICGHDAWHQGHCHYKCDMGHSFSASTSCIKGGDDGENNN